jgi:hypothetical protein
MSLAKNGRNRGEIGKYQEWQLSNHFQITSPNDLDPNHPRTAMAVFRELQCS